MTFNITFIILTLYDWVNKKSPFESSFSYYLMLFLFLEVGLRFQFIHWSALCVVSPEPSMMIWKSKIAEKKMPVNRHVTRNEPNGNYQSTIVCARIRLWKFLLNESRFSDIFFCVCCHFGNYYLKIEDTRLCGFCYCLSLLLLIFGLIFKNEVKFLSINQFWILVLSFIFTKKISERQKKNTIKITTSNFKCSNVQCYQIVLTVFVSESGAK